MKTLILILTLFALSGCTTFGVIKKSSCTDLFDDFANCEIVKQ